MRSKIERSFSERHRTDDRSFPNKAAEEMEVRPASHSLRRISGRPAMRSRTVGRFSHVVFEMNLNVRECHSLNKISYSDHYHFGILDITRASFLIKSR
jgi:hypothetical protein